MIAHAALLLAALCVPTGPTPAQGKPPKVVSLEPADLARDVDAKKVRTLTVRFDQPMNTRGFSVCGGGPKFPEIKRPQWKDAKTLVVPVELAPDHDYELSLNCPAARNFRSARGGVPLDPTPWRFSTLPAKQLSPREQKKLNEKALAELVKVIDERYSYRDLRVKNWSALVRKHKNAIVASKSEKAWAEAAGEMLRPTNDLHLYLRASGTTVGAGSRRIDPLFRNQLLGKYLIDLEQHKGFATAKTKDGIAYLVIGSWTERADINAVEEFIAGLGDAKGLILDVRPNSGGSETLAKNVARWFVKGTQIYAKNRYRTGKGDKGFGEVYDRQITGLPAAKRFGRPVAVLMSRYCMSSCEAFLLMMKQGEQCTLIGQTSYGSSGNPKRYELPNGVELFVPSWQALRVDGTCFEGEGIKPDLEVVPTAKQLEAEDPILEKALEHLRKQK